MCTIIKYYNKILYYNKIKYTKCHDHFSRLKKKKQLAKSKIFSLQRALNKSTHYSSGKQQQKSIRTYDNNKCWQDVEKLEP